MSGSLLVAGEDYLKGRIKKRVVNRNYNAAGDSEKILDVLAQQGFHENLRAGHRSHV
jgi:hypothetical protein